MSLCPFVSKRRGSVTKRRKGRPVDTSRYQSRNQSKARAQASNASLPTKANNTPQRLTLYISVHQTRAHHTPFTTEWEGGREKHGAVHRLHDSYSKIQFSHTQAHNSPVSIFIYHPRNPIKIMPLVHAVWHRATALHNPRRECAMYHPTNSTSKSLFS